MNIRRSTLVLSLTITGLCQSGPALPSSVISMNLQSMTQAAGVIFAGTVVGIRNELAPSGETPITRVTFSKLTWVKGKTGGDTVTMSLRGGTAYGSIFSVSGMPRFEMSKRYVVLARDLGSERNIYIPIVGLYQGFFPVAPGATGQEPSVRDWRYRPLVHISREQIAVIDSTRGSQGTGGNEDIRDSLHARSRLPVIVLSPSVDPGTRVSEGEFIELLRTLVR